MKESDVTQPTRLKANGCAVTHESSLNALQSRAARAHFDERPWLGRSAIAAWDEASEPIGRLTSHAI